MQFWGGGGGGGGGGGKNTEPNPNCSIIDQNYAELPSGSCKIFYL